MSPHSARTDVANGVETDFTIRPIMKRRNIQSVSPAQLEIRDAVFRELIRISPASNYMEELSPAPEGGLHGG